MKKSCLFAGSAIVCAHLAAGEAAAQPGYSIRGNQVVVNSPGHWKNWEFAEGTLEIGSSGELRPRRWRRPANAVLDIVDHLRWMPPEELADKDPSKITLLDAIQGVSNREGIANALDGDMNTWWEPEFLSSEVELATQWWFIVDLGRTVMADRIVLKFVDESLGDPFLLFDVLVSNGQAPGEAPASGNLDFRPVMQTLHPNKNQRLFEIDLSQYDPGPVLPVYRSYREWELADAARRKAAKRVVRFVQVVVHGSDFDRGREIGEEAYGQLLEEAPEEAGAIEYLKRLSDGGVAVLGREDYERLPPRLRAGVRYYRRERPRLAELEVWGPGDDLARGIVARGESIVNTARNSVNPLNLIDGNIESQEKMGFGNRLNPDRPAAELLLDLGSFFWISGLRLAGGRGEAREARLWNQYRLEVSDGSREVDGSLAWQTLAERNAGRGFGKRISLNVEEFQPVIARFFRIEWDLSQGNYNNAVFSELQLFGDGFQPRVELTSGLIEPGRGRNLTTIEWDSDLQPETRVEVQTRTGNSLDTLLHYYTSTGIEVAEAAYNRIRFAWHKGDIVPEAVAGSDWEPWSEPYQAASGSAVTSPSPRRYLKIRARLLSGDPEAFATLGAVRVNFSGLVAGSLHAALTPTRVDSLGVERSFSLLVELGPLEQGFDELLITPPPGMELSFDPAGDPVFAGPAPAFAEGDGPGGFRLKRVRVLSDAPDSLHLAFAAVDPEVEVFRVDFRGVLLTAGGRLRAQLRNSEGEGFWQPVDEKVPRTSLQLVAVPERKRLLGDLTVRPPVFSPNGDGVNDELRLVFTVMMVAGSAAVQAEIFDLAGRRVRRLEERREVGAGGYSMSWDGRDDKGELVPPGVYAVRLKPAVDTADTRVGNRELLRTLAVAY